jgi:hypothetical protein
MKKAWKILAIEYPTILFLGCIAHSLNLLIGNIMKISWCARLIRKAKDLIKYFKSYQIPAAILKKHQLASYDH